MKSQLIIALGAVMSLASCTDQNKVNHDQAMSEMNTFLDSLDNDVNNGTLADWDATDRRHETLKDRIESNSAEMSEDMKMRHEQMDDRYELAKTKFKNGTDEFNQEANAQMDNIETWLDRSADNTGEVIQETGDDMENSWKKSMNWLDENYEKLEDNTKKEYDELKVRLNDNDRG